MVFAHTAALAESLPVVGEGAVVKAFSAATKEVAGAARQYRGREFGVADLVKEVECSRRSVRRVLNELAELGYLAKRETGPGLANEFRPVEGAEPGTGEVELPGLDEPFAPGEEPSAGRGQSGDGPDGSPSRVSSTGFVWVVGVGTGVRPDSQGRRATIPAPESNYSAPPPPG